MSMGSPRPSSLQDGRRNTQDGEDPCWLIPHPVLYHPSVTILIRGDRYFSPWTHIKSCKVWNDENKFVISQNISSTQVLLWRYLHIYTIHYCTIRIMYYTQVMQLKVKLEMHLNAGMNASLLLISNSYFKALYLCRCSSLDSKIR